MSKEGKLLRMVSVLLGKEKRGLLLKEGRQRVLAHGEQQLEGAQG